MELKHIKIDTDIRMKVEEEIKEDKVHFAKEVNVNKDLKDKGNTYYRKVGKYESEGKKYIVVDGVKNADTNLSVEVEKLESINQENSRGGFLDTKK